MRSSVLKDKDGNLITAARAGQLELIANMVERDGVDVNFQESEVRFRLFCCPPSCIIFRFGLFYSCGNQGSATALMTVAQKGFLDILKYLLVHGADPNIQDRVCRCAKFFLSVFMNVF